MELIITEKEPLTKTELTICLNMIVKDESHIIKNTLEKLCSKIKFSYWVICDTGSTDNTKEIIIDFFKEKNIMGELYTDEWKNFAHNRTLALERAYAKTDLLLVFDADDEIVGDIVMPKVNTKMCDEYHLKFGSPTGTAYTRVLLVNNQKRFIYQSVIHEFISCIEAAPSISTVVQGDYYVVSGRSGNRSKDPEKYLKDAKILEAAHAEALKNNDTLYHRYSFYCANSYRDHGSFEDAIKWYKITLSQDNWEQEQYMSCFYTYECYVKLNQQETGFFYLVKAFKYDPERLECLYPLLVHYCCESQNQVAYSYYLHVKDYFENNYLNTNMDRKLFVTIDKYNFFVPYYMILIADKMQDFDCVIRMYEIVFIKKMPIFQEWYIKNFLYNLQFFVHHVKPENKAHFTKLANEYIRFLHDIKIKLHTFDCLKDYDTRFGLDISYIFKNLVVTERKTFFSEEQCASSKNILFYTGFSDVEWNYSYMQSNALGGSEKAVAYLSKEMAALLLDKDYKIYVAGALSSESFDNVTYVSFQDIPEIIKTVPFHIVICSRYISFLETFKECSFHQFYIWAHDTLFLPYGCNLTDKEIITKWDKYITGCICQTEWHANLFKGLYPELTNKISIINNGLSNTISVTTDKSVTTNKSVSIPEKNTNTKIRKQTNKFIYSSRPERGLEALLNLWPKIVDVLPDAELFISSYVTISQQSILDLIEKYESVKCLGKLNTEQLYSEMKSAEYWLYPTEWKETSCITALEMLMSEVICLYYPVAGLPYTMKDNGIQVDKGNEIETLINLTTKDKVKLRENGRKYAETCSWKNRANEWLSQIFPEKNANIHRERIIELHNTLFMPKNHIDFLQKLSIDFKPKVIYDIGSNVLAWTREAKKIWNNSEIIAFDILKEAEFLYKEHNVKYHIGVLSKEDNLSVKFYENKEHPTGNSYYKEIGHSKSNEIYPEDAFTEYNAMTLLSVVKNNKFKLPDLIKMDVQGAELDIIKGGLDIINNAKYLIVELQDTQYNRGAPLAETTIQFLEDNNWKLIARKFCDNGPDADYCFKNKRYDSNFKIKIINLNRRPDRKKKIINEMKLKGVKKYEFVEAIDGKKIKPSTFIKNLFKENNFNYRKGVIGCALSHYSLWHNLLNDNDNNYYVILEDDVSIVENFDEKIQTCIDIIHKNDIEYALIGGFYIYNKYSNNTNISFDKIIDPICHGTYGYIISRSACSKLINNIQQNGIKYAIDYSLIYTNCLDMYKINNYIVISEAYQLHNNMDTDIQTDYDSFIFDNIPNYPILFTDWLKNEYYGEKCNFEKISNLLDTVNVTQSTPLCKIMGKYNSDKGDIKINDSWHNYTTVYYSIFKNIQMDKLRIFELGLGTNNINIPSNMGINGSPGASLYGWSEFFINSDIFGADIDKNILFNTDKIKTFFCDQTNPDIIRSMWNNLELKDNFDIIIDDGLHSFNANVCFFENSIYKLKPNGYYIIEDIGNCETSLFVEQIKKWKKKYHYLEFTLLDIPSKINKYDNRLLVIYYI
jgi:FkbM family methyltransferase